MEISLIFPQYLEINLLCLSRISIDLDPELLQHKNNFDTFLLFIGL